MNGYASVCVTAGSALLAVHLGFRRVAIIAMAFYALAGLLSRSVGGTETGLQEDE